MTQLLTALVLCFGIAAEPKTTPHDFKSHDGHAMFGKLTLPEKEGQHPVVIYVQAAEGMTVDMKRPLPGGKTFNYFDLYRQKLPETNVGFFSYEGRGITNGDSPPRFEKIDREVYNTSTLDNKVRDVMTAVRLVQKLPGVDPTRIYLMGASEGTLLAVDAASRMGTEIAGLVLYGVMAENMRQVFTYIMSDGAFLPYRTGLDKDKDGQISKAEFDVALKDGFGTVDKDGDGFFTVKDVKLMTKVYLDAIDKDDFSVLDAWTKTNAAVSTPNHWFKDHFSYKSMWPMLAKLEMPVGCFHGTFDPMTPVGAVKEMEKAAVTAGKKNIEFRYFEGGDHSLGVAAYFVTGKVPAGHQAIFEFISRVAAR